MKVVKIYILYDPRYPQEIRYVGKTTQKLARRLSGHISDAKNRRYNFHNCNWIYSLLKENIAPIIEEIDSIKCFSNDKKEWEWLEKFWISQFKSWGFNLNNLTDGGDGNQNQIFPEDHYIKISKKLKGRNRPDYVRKKISESNKGKPKSRSHIENTRKCIIAKQGRPVVQYSLNGEFIKEWPYLKSAALFYKVNSSSLIRCCQGKFKSSAGYLWRYKNEDIV